MNNKKMNPFSSWLPWLLGVSLFFPALASAQDLRFTALLHPYMSGYQGLDPQPGFDVDDAGRVFFNSGGKIYDLTQGAYVQSGGMGPADISSLAVSPSSAVLAVAGTRIVSIWSGEVNQVVDLPAPGMKAALVGNDLWVYGGSQAPNHALYLVRSDGGHKKMLEAPAPITAVTGAGVNLFFAADNLIYRVNWGHECQLIAAIPGPEITSLAYDPQSGALFFAAGGSVYGLKDGDVGLLGRSMGDELKFKDGALYAYSPRFYSLYRLDGIMNIRETPAPEAAAAPAPQAAKLTPAQAYYEKATAKASEGQYLDAYFLLKTVILLDPDWAEPYYTAGQVCEYLGYTRDFRFIGYAAKFYQAFLDRAGQADYRRADTAARIETLHYIDQWMPASLGGKYVTPQEAGLAIGGSLAWLILCIFLIP